MNNLLHFHLDFKELYTTPTVGSGEPKWGKVLGACFNHMFYFKYLNIWESKHQCEQCARHWVVRVQDGMTKDGTVALKVPICLGEPVNLTRMRPRVGCRPGQVSGVSDG